MYIQRDFLEICGSEILARRGIKAVSFESVDSTSSAARRYAEGGGGGKALFVADTQSGGRGRMGKSFFSPAKTGIYMTLMLDVTEDAPMSVVSLTSAAAVAVSSVCERLCGESCGIKWVNDIYLHGKKVCGILAESFSAHGRKYVLIGVGVNLATEDFPDDLESIAGSLGARADRRREAVLALCEALCDIHERLREGDFSHMEEYRRRSTVLGREVTFVRNGVSAVGVAEEIKDSGALAVRLRDGSLALLGSGEISLRVRP